MITKTAIERKYTRRRKFGREYVVRLVVGHQSFELCHRWKEKEAKWLQRMLAGALHTLIAEESK